MSRGVNKVILIGNLGGDPEVRYTQEGKAIATIRLATSMGWKDKETGSAQERTEWHRVIFFNRLAEIVGEFLKQGSKIYVEGSLRTRDWEDKSGQKHRTTEILANEMQMLDSKNSKNSKNGNTQPVQEPASSNNAVSTSEQPVVDVSIDSLGEDSFEDQIPF